MVEVAAPTATFLNSKVKDDNSPTINNQTKQGIQCRLKLMAVDLPTQVPLCVRGRIHHVGKEDGLSFSFTFGFKYGKFEKLIKDFNDDYHNYPHQVIDPEPGVFGVVHMENDDVYVRVKVLNVERGTNSGYTRFTALAIDYGYEVEVSNDLFYLVDRFRLDDYRYAFCVTCRLPDWPGQKLFPALDECRQGSDVDVFILSAYEPCLAVFNPIGKTATDSINESIIYRDLDDEASLAIRVFMAQPHLERPIMTKMIKPSAFTTFNWKLVTIVDASKAEAVVVRDLFMSVRVIFIQNRLNKLLKDKEFLEPLVLKPEAAVVGLPVIVYDEKTEQYYRGKITACVPETGWKVKCVDYPCRELVYNKSPLKDDGTIADLYVMPEVLLNIPSQYYTVSLVDAPEPARNELGGILYSNLIDEILPPGSVSRILPTSGTMKVKIHDESDWQTFEDLPRRVYNGLDGYIDEPDPRYREYLTIFEQRNHDDSDFSVASAP